jgi:hypothetical protein
MGVHLMGVHLMSVHLMGVYLIGRYDQIQGNRLIIDLGSITGRI